MLPDRGTNPGPLTYESGALPIAPCSPASGLGVWAGGGGGGMGSVITCI